MRRAIYLVLLFSVNNLSAIEPHFFNPTKKTKFVSFYNYNIDGQWSKRKLTYPKRGFEYIFDLGWKVFTTENNLWSEFSSLRKVAENGKNGDIVVLQRYPATIDNYVTNVLEKTDKQFILVVEEDFTFPYEWEKGDAILEALNDGRIIHLFTTNPDLKECPPNVSQIPIGIRYKGITPIKRNPGRPNPMTPRDQDAQFRTLFRTLKPTNKRNIRPLCDFGMSNSSEDRVDAFGEDRIDITRKLEAMGSCDFLQSRVPYSEYLKLKSERAFEVSPNGIGVNCFRTWEALILGSIVIVKTSFLDPLYEGLPVVIVNDWDEITEYNLKKWLAEYGDVFHDPEMREKLTHDYWMKKIKKVQYEYREKALAKNA